MRRDNKGRDACIGLASRVWYRVWCVSPKTGSNRNSKFSHAQQWIFGPVGNPDGIPIGLRIVRHEAFEMRLGDSMLSHNVVEVMPEKDLSIIVLGLEVAASDDHEALVGFVVYVAGHGGPLGDAFDMVRHDPSMLEIPARLHAPNQINPTTGANLEHLEDENFVHLVTLAWELIPLDIGPGANTSKLGDAIHNS